MEQYVVNPDLRWQEKVRADEALRARLARVRAVSFDGDGTLWDFEAAMLLALRLVLDELQRRVPGPAAEALTVGELRKLRDAAAAEMVGASLEDIRLEGFRRAVRAAGREDDALAAELTAHYMTERYANLRLFRDVQPALDALAPHYRLGVISNGNTDTVRAGVRTEFAAVLFGPELGFSKPDPRIFFQACHRLDCLPEELLHVGDSLENDIVGAHAAGVLAVWLRRGGLYATTAVPTSENEPDLTINSMDDVVTMLRMAQK